MLADQELLNSVGSSNLRNQLNDLWVPVPSVATNNQEAALDTFWDREENAGDERLAVVGFLEDNDFFPQPGAVMVSAVGFWTFMVGLIAHVPGFWSVNGWNSTVFTLMVASGWLCSVELERCFGSWNS